MQAGNLLFVLVIIFVNASITHAQQTCGQCISTAKSTFKSDKQTCRDDFRSGTIATRAEFKACKMMKKSNMYSTMATWYQSGNPCSAPGTTRSPTPTPTPAPTPAPSQGPTPAPTPAPPTVVGWTQGVPGESCTTVCGGSCNTVRQNEVTSTPDLQYLYNYMSLPAGGYNPAEAAFSPFQHTANNVFLYVVPRTPSTCDATDPAAKRICCCGGDADCPLN